MPPPTRATRAATGAAAPARPAGTAAGDAVDRVLDARRGRGRRLPGGLALTGAVLLHAALFAFLLMPARAEPPEPLRIAPVRVVPLRALGAPEAPPPRREPEPAPVPPPPAPAPEPTAPPPPPAPEPSPPPPEPPPPGPQRTPPPREPARETSREADETAGEQSARRGSPEGNPLARSSFGADSIGLDNPDFQYDYYIDRLLAAIESRWRRPLVEERIEAVVRFRIERDGSVSELTLARSSGVEAFDLAALRAVRNASPLPPLPPRYRGDSLGVNLIVR